MKRHLAVACIVCLVSVIGSAADARAATYSVVPQVAAAYELDFTPLPQVPNFDGANVGTPHIYQVDFVLHATGFDAGANQRGFGNIVFDVFLSGDSLESAVTGNWLSDIPVVDTNGPEPGGLLPQLEISADFGADTRDLIDILVSIDIIPSPHPLDPRPHVGSPPGTVVGFMYLIWDGIGPETVTVQPKTNVNGPQASFARIDNGMFQQDVNAMLIDATLTFGVEPAPTVNGDFNGDGNVDGADFVIWQTNFPNISGEATLEMGDANGDGNIDGADFVIWQTNFPTISGTIAAVPEPQGLLLITLGAVGLWAVRSSRGRR